MAYDLPDGYEDEGDFLTEARERFQEAVDFDRENRDEAETDLKFFAGDQWDPDDIAAREGLPCLTINSLPQFVAQVVGDIRINRPAIKARPAEDADQDLASVREGLIRAIEHQSSASSVYAQAGQAQVACGIGNFRARLDYLSDDAFDRDIFIRSIPNPFAVVWDPLITDPTGRDARYCFVVEEIAKKTYEAKYGKEVPSELGDILQRQNWMSADTVRVTEYWLVKERPAEIAMLQDGRIVELTAKNRARLTPLIAANATGPMVRKTVRKSVCMYLISGTKILEKPVEYKLSRIPIFRVPGWEVNTGTRTVRFGLVRFARDPARLKNYWRSVQAQKLALAPRQQWVIHESQPGDQEDFRQAAENGDTVLTWSGNVPPERLDPPQIEAALLQAAEQNSQDMKDVTGLHDASLGLRSNETSGKAILARQREGDVATYIYPDNLKAAIAECGRVINEWIPAVYDTARSIRVLGEDETQKVMRVNDPNDPESIDLGKGKYDIVVETGPSYSTKRVEAAESMMAFVQAVPVAAQVAADLIAKAQDWPLATEIGERLKRAIPAQLTESPDDEQTPEQMQARQQAQQQAQMQAEMQQQAAMLTLAEQEAKVLKLRAEAQKIGTPEPGQPAEHPLDLMLKEQEVRRAVAEADKAEAEAAKARAEVPALVAKTEAEAAVAVASVPHEIAQAEAGAASAHIGARSADADLQRKPLEAEHAKADLKLKLNPPKEKGGGA